MEFTKEQIEKAKKCKTEEELKELVEKENLTLDDEEIKEIFNLTRTGELSDEDLNNVAGGTKYSTGVDGPNGFHKYAIVTLFNAVGKRCMEIDLENYVRGDPDHNNRALFCKDCVNRFTHGPTSYCSKRWEGNDPLKG